MKIKTDDTGVIECRLSKQDRQAIRSCWQVLEELAFHGRNSIVPNEVARMADELGAMATSDVVAFETKVKDEAKNA